MYWFLQGVQAHNLSQNDHEMEHSVKLTIEKLRKEGVESKDMENRLVEDVFDSVYARRDRYFACSFALFGIGVLNYKFR